MIQVILGKRGSGKTKRLIDFANQSIEKEQGNIVFIDDDTRYVYDLKRDIRFVNLREYGIKNADMLYGMISGMLAANYDISLIVIDPLMHVLNHDLAALEQMFAKMDALSEIGHCNFLVAVSADAADMPEFVTSRAI